MAVNPKLLFFLYSCFALTIALSSSSPDAPTVYEILPKFGLPSGLLPDSVKSYSLSSEGEFVVELENPCYIHFDYVVYYEKTVTGKLKYGSITALKGIQVQRFFLWFDVDDIRVDLPPSDSIYFQVGMINKRLDIGQFQAVRSCSTKGYSSCHHRRSSIKGMQLPIPKDEVEILLTE